MKSKLKYTYIKWVCDYFDCLFWVIRPIIMPYFSVCHLLNIIVYCCCSSPFHFFPVRLVKSILPFEQTMKKENLSRPKWLNYFVFCGFSQLRLNNINSNNILHQHRNRVKTKQIAGKKSEEKKNGNDTSIHFEMVSIVKRMITQITSK